MFVIIGAAGKVGFATSCALRQADVPVRAVLRKATNAQRLLEIGCEIAVADLQDTYALIKAIEKADVVQVILPPSPEARDGAQEMQDTIESLATALEQTKPKRLLAISDYGAHVTSDIGMPSMYRTFEQRLSQLSGHKVILRSAEHMQNWGRVIPAAIASGSLASFHDPVDMTFPSISALDLGLIAADLLLHPDEAKELQIVHAEGPQRYSASDVATALSRLLGHPIDAVVVPRSQWMATLERGLSSSLALLLVKANDAQNLGGLVDIEQGIGEVRYGTIELIDVLQSMLH